MLRLWGTTLLATLVFLAPACSIQRLAVDRLGDALAAGGTTYASDDDPQLVREALPFTLKLIESLLAESPEHPGLLLAAASGFTQYAYAFVQEDADRLEEESFEAAAAERGRAKRLYVRARNYGLRLLDASHSGLSGRLADDPKIALETATRADVPALYWTAASWGSAISLSKDDPAMVADLPIVEALIDRALALDESWNDGSLHSFLIAYEPARPGGGPAGYERATRHFERAVALSEGKLASPYVAWAESVAIAKQDVDGFKDALEKALAIDPDARPAWRLENLVSQSRAEWLLDRTDALFLIEEEGDESAAGEDEAEVEPADELERPAEEEPKDPPPFAISLASMNHAAALARHVSR